MLTHVAPNVVVTWQNGEVSRGANGVRKFYDEVLNSPDKIVANIASTLKVDDLSILYGSETAIAFGSIHDHITLNHSIARAAFLGTGDVLALDSRWTATLVKLDGQWKVASYHVSTDAFFNPILSMAIAAGKRSALLAGVGGLIPGALGVWFLVTAQLHERVRIKPQNRILIEAIDEPGGPPMTAIGEDVCVVLVPGLLYKQFPETGADGTALRDIANAMAIPFLTIPLDGTEGLEASASIIGEWLQFRVPAAKAIVLVSLSKGSAEVMHAIASRWSCVPAGYRMD